jgi:Uma2 family endonuclease
MTRAAPKRATYEDVLSAPENVVAELVNGELHTSPRPASPHAHAASVAGMDIGGMFQRGRGGPGGWWILDEPELHLDQDVLVPDLAGWRRERMPTIPDVPFFDLSPDWLCEVLSPSTERFDRMVKPPIYASAKVAFIWLLDPRSRSLEFFRLSQDGYTRIAGFIDDAKMHAPPFDAVELDLGAFWLSSE